MPVFGDKDDRDDAGRKAGSGDPHTRREGAPDFSNVRSGGSSTAPGDSDGATTDRERTYVVVKGDSLSKIAEREYGDATRWRQIFEANSDTIKNPDLIYPGQQLRLP
jgi:nucleoid-associated protein YgaU